MERPYGAVEVAIDEYDHEITPLQADIIALTDALLERRPENSPFSFINIPLAGDKRDLLDEIEKTRFASLLTSPDEQLAIESDGSYYPQLDIRKKHLQLEGVRLVVWGQDEQKRRYLHDIDSNPEYPLKYKEYPDEIDKHRGLDVRVTYTSADEQLVQETIELHTATVRQDAVGMTRSIWISAYAETGYEGHNYKRGARNIIGDEGIEEFLDFIVRHVEDYARAESP